MKKVKTRIDTKDILRLWEIPYCEIQRLRNRVWDRACPDATLRVGIVGSFSSDRRELALLHQEASRDLKTRRPREARKRVGHLRTLLCKPSSVFDAILSPVNVGIAAAASAQASLALLIGDWHSRGRVREVHFVAGQELGNRRQHEEAKEY